VWRLLDGKGRCERGGGWTESTTAMGGDRRRNGELTVMDSTALRRWTAQRQLDGEERHDGDLTTMDDEEWRERNGNVDTAGGGSNKGQRVIT
jgi:hypothetical protein